MFKKAKLPDMEEFQRDTKTSVSFLAGFVGTMTSQIESLKDGMIVLGEEHDKLVKRTQEQSEKMQASSKSD